MSWKWKNLGQFTMETTTMRVSDPCYNKDVWCCGVLEDCITGTWNAYIKEGEYYEFGKRIGLLVVQHVNCQRDLKNLRAIMRFCPVDFTNTNLVVGVDSGQAGFFDDKYYNDTESVDLENLETDFSDSSWGEPCWYHACCDLTLSKQRAGVIPYGAVSSSGMGDGTYQCFVHYNDDGLVDMAILSFL